MCTKEDLPDRLSDFTNLTRRPSGEYHAACPESGRHGDRLRIFLSDRVSDTGQRYWSVFCRQCSMHKFIPVDEGTPDVGKLYSKPRTDYVNVPRSFVEETHANLGKHRVYFARRGISDEVIKDHRLGWCKERERYSIPCFDDDTVYAVQFRASRPDQEPKYISYKGGFNRVLFNSHAVKGRQMPFVFIVEAPLDALALESIGLPAVAQFDGNSRNSWQPEWNDYLKGAVMNVIIADNDDAGMLIALGKKARIPNSIVVTPPGPFKDVGEYLQSGRSLDEFIPPMFLATKKDK